MGALKHVHGHRDVPDPLGDGLEHLGAKLGCTARKGWITPGRASAGTRFRSFVPIHIA
jgi:hypothetical protein